MLLNFDDIYNLLLSKNINIYGAFHIGAYECEELTFYNNYLRLNDKDIIWIDANNTKVIEALKRGIPNVYNAVITDKNDKEVIFNISNNLQYSSLLDLGTISQEQRSIIYVDKIYTKSITIDTFFERNNLDASKYDFWKINIQGAELMALKGAVKSIKQAKAIYIKVNVKKIYKNCCIINDIDNFLSKYKFKRLLTNMTFYGYGDALYISDK